MPGAPPAFGALVLGGWCGEEGKPRTWESSWRRAVLPSPRQGGLAQAEEASFIHGHVGDFDPDYCEWLERRLASERLVLLNRLHIAVNEMLTGHHRTLLDEVTGHIGPKCSVTGSRRDDRMTGEGGISPVTEQSSVVTDLATETKEVRSATNESTPIRIVELPHNGESVHAHCSLFRSPSEVSNMVGTKTQTSGSTNMTSVSEKRKYKSEYIENLVSQRAFAAPHQRWVGRLVSSPCFEFMSWLLILLNMALMGLEVQYTGCKVGRDVGATDCFEELLDPSMDLVFNALAVAFCCAFGIELCLRVAHTGCARSKLSAWLWFDAVVLSFSIVDTMNRLGTPLSLVVNPTVMRTTRMFRMFRMVKFLRARESFHMLFLLMKSLLASRHALIWSVLILFFTMTSVGLVMNQLIYTYLSDPSVPERERLEVYDYFGTTTRMLITMFEITLGNWAIPSRLLMANVSQWWGIFIVVYRCWFCFSLVHVTAAVFITETSRVASDDEVQMMRKKKIDKRTIHFLNELFKEINTNGDGYITLEELRCASQDEGVKSLLQLLDLEMHDVEELFNLMDSGAGQVTQDEFVQGVLRLRGQAKSSKQVAMMKLLKLLDVKVDEVASKVAGLVAPGDAFTRQLR